MGYYKGDWTYRQYRAVVDQAVKEQRETVTLNTEGCSFITDQCVERWAANDGYRTDIRMDYIIIYLEN